MRNRQLRGFKPWMVEKNSFFRYAFAITEREDTQMTIGEKIQYMRKKAGLNQEQLAEAVGVSRQAVSKWETGEATPEVGKLLLLCRAFGVTADWLISDDGPDAPSGPDRNREDPKAEARAEEPEYAPEPRSPNWAESAPRVIGRLLKKHGWFLGARAAITGAAFAVLGWVVRMVVSRLFREGEYVSPLNGEAEVVVIPGFLYNKPYASTVERALNTVSSFFIVLGVVLLVTGIILTLTLRKYRERK